MANKVEITAEPDKQELFIIMEFEAPCELVFKAFTDPELYKEWIGPLNLTTEIDTFESVSGGRWRYIQRDWEGMEFAFHGVNHLVRPHDLIIGTFEYEGLSEEGHVIMETSRFESLPGNRTRLVEQSVFQSVEDRDGMLESGMELGVNESYERLDELLERILNE